MHKGKIRKCQWMLDYEDEEIKSWDQWGRVRFDLNIKGLGLSCIKERLVKKIQIE